MITDNRQILNEADSLTGWGGTCTRTLTTADPTPIEDSGCIGVEADETNCYSYYTTSTTNLTATLIYAWMILGGAPGTVAQGGGGIYLVANAVHIAYHLVGSDAAAFRHEAGPTRWQCLALDTSALPTANTLWSGTAANFNVDDTTAIGVVWRTVAKSKGADNCFVDIIRYGNDGISLTTGTSGDPGTFEEIAAADRSISNQDAHGIVRKLGAGLFSCQGPLNFGNTTQNTYFSDTSTVLAFEDRGFGTDKYYVNCVSGGTTANLHFQLGTKSGTENGVEGCQVIVPSGVGGLWTASDDDLSAFFLYGSKISGFDRGIVLSSNTTNGPLHEIFDCTFIGCGQIDTGQTEFKNNSVSASVEANGSVLISNTNLKSGLSFVMSSTGNHAIEIDTAGTYTFTNFNYSGFSTSNGQTNSCIYNTSGGDVTINIVGGDTPTVRNEGVGTVTIQQAVTLTITGIKTESSVTVLDINTGLILDSEMDSNGQVQSVDSIIDGGTGYTVSDTLTVQGGTGTAATLTVDSVSSGVITGASVNTEGDYDVAPTNPVSVTGGTGNDDATFNLDISGEFAYSGQASEIVTIVIFHLNYKEIRFAHFQLPSESSELPVTQVIDRVYDNP